ncbi:MAG TPA: Npt1/Npt2 family nucleotide transporter [Kofleriaceae bacterium]
MASEGTQAGWKEKLLSPFAKVEPGEAGVALLMTLTVFLILCAYYVLKPAREQLLLPTTLFGIPGPELKSYAGAAMALVFMGILPLYSRLANQVGRLRLINICYSIVLVCLVAFFVMAQLGVPQLGLAFFIWIGLVNMFLVAQFWSYANDIYSEEQGKRLFAIIAVGGSLGAIVGPKVAELVSVYSGMLMAAGILGACIALFNVIDKLDTDKPEQAEKSKAPVGGADGFKLVLTNRYLLLIALMVLLANFVNTTGEFLLSNAAAEHAKEIVHATAATAHLTGDAFDKAVGKEIGKFYSDMYFWVNLIGFIVQAFIVSRVLKWFGVRVALFVMPLVAFGGYAAFTVIGGLAVIRLCKIGENAADYSIQNTVRQALWLPTSREDKYKAKAAIDTFFLRLGDAFSGFFILLVFRTLHMSTRFIGAVNVGIVVVWIALAVGIAREHKKLEDKAEADGKPTGEPTSEKRKEPRGRLAEATT